MRAGRAGIHRAAHDHHRSAGSLRPPHHGAAARCRQEGPRGKVFSVVNAKGGSGATTVAVNLALALQSAHGQTALVDLAPLGHAALHMNLKPVFTVADATRNLHRMDTSLLESFMTRHSGGLQLLAGTNIPAAVDPSTAEFVRLFDMLVTHYRYVVVDASSRFDAASRLIANLSETVLLVACTDVASLWSAARVQQYLGETGSRERVRLVLNRFRKVPGFSEADAEAAVGAKLLWRVPNQYFAVSSAIDRGTPVMEQRNTEIARCFCRAGAGIDAQRRGRKARRVVVVQDGLEILGLYGKSSNLRAHRVPAGKSRPASQDSRPPRPGKTGQDLRRLRPRRSAGPHPQLRSTAKPFRSASPNASGCRAKFSTKSSASARSSRCSKIPPSPTFWSTASTGSTSNAPANSN